MLGAEAGEDRSGKQGDGQGLRLLLPWARTTPERTGVGGNAPHPSPQCSGLGWKAESRERDRSFWTEEEAILMVQAARLP